MKLKKSSEWKSRAAADDSSRCHIIIIIRMESTIKTIAADSHPTNRVGTCREACTMSIVIGETAAESLRLPLLPDNSTFDGRHKTHTHTHHSHISFIRHGRPVAYSNIYSTRKNGKSKEMNPSSSSWQVLASFAK